MNEPASSAPLSFADGRTLVIHFPAFTPRLTFHEDHTLTVEIIDGDNAGFRDTIPYRAVTLRQKLVVLSWKEQVGSSVVQVLDREAGQTYALLAPAEGGLLSLEGTIEWG